VELSIQREDQRNRRDWMRGVGAAVLGTLLARGAGAARRARQVVVDPQQAMNLKSVYVYSFCRFVAWPAAAFDRPDAPLVIGVFGDDKMRDTLAEIAARRQAQGRSLEIKKLASPDDGTPCHLVMITADVAADKRQAMLKRLKGTAVLIVTEATGAGQEGAHVNFFLENATVKFEINVPAAQASQLRIDPQLTALKVAKLLGADAAARVN